MILQSNQAPFPLRSDQALLIAGLLFFILGQQLLNFGRDFVAAQAPIDYAHWCLLVGALLFLPFAARLPKRNIHLITIPVFIAGIAAIIGMFVLDFIFWSLPAGDLADGFYSHVRAEPSIWQVFIAIGPNWVFGTGLALPSLSYFHRSRLGVALVLIGVLMQPTTGRDLIVVSYALITLGYLMCFNWLRREEA